MKARFFAVITVALVSLGPDAWGASELTPEQVKQFEVSTPQPKYPETARLRRITGLGYFLLRINRATGKVIEITVLRSTGNQLLDSASISTLRLWRFKGGKVLPSIRQIHPSSRDQFADRDIRIMVPVHFQLARNGVVTKT